jgi:uncharacterized protein (UPF0261 family)
LPLGFPKLLVSTLAGRDATHDTTVMPSVVDIAGLNRILREILSNAAGAVCGMVNAKDRGAIPSRPMVAVSMFGVTTEGATYLRGFLEDAGYEVVVFHANGTGGRVMERLSGEGFFVGVIDWTTSEITDELTGGICTAGAERLDSVVASGAPLVLVPGAVDVINVSGSIPERFKDRAFHWHLPTVPLIRTDADESFQVGLFTARKLNKAEGSVKIVVPMMGFSSLDIPGGPFWDEQADEAWIEGVKSELRPDIPLTTLPYHINSKEFAEAVATTFLGMLEPANDALPLANTARKADI